MPCDTRLAQREIDAALERLREGLADNSATVVIGENGALAFNGWESGGMTDLCAYNALANENNWDLQRAIEFAQATSGNTLDMTMLNSGVHSHDGGMTWHPGH